MIGTGIAQLRYAASLLFGVSFAPWSLDHLVDAALRTRKEFGPLRSEGTDLVSGPTLDDETRHAMQTRRFQAQLRRALGGTAYYAGLFAWSDLNARGLRFEDIGRLPTTSKTALETQPDAFVRRGSRPVFRTTTTGTIGRPTSVCFSAYELHVYVALAALGLLLEGAVGPEDIVQISTSSRATLGNTCFAGACAQIGAQVYLAGLVEPSHSLALLSEERSVPGKKRRASVMSTYPSYLGQLVEEGLHLGYGPDDFGLERISVGGELVTAGLKARAQRLFGAITFMEGYGTTEIWPLMGTRCEVGHLHYEPSRGLVELVDTETRTHTAAGSIGTLVATPFAPYRETTLVLRYDTGDLARAIEGPLRCSLRHIPGTSELLGKRRMAVRHADGWTTPRDVLEGLENLEAVPLPARCGFWAVPGGVAVEVMVRGASAAVRGEVTESLERCGVPLRQLTLVEHQAQLQRPLPLRGDLRESGFVLAPPTLVSIAGLSV